MSAAGAGYPLHLALVIAIALASSVSAQNPAMVPKPLDQWPGAEIVEGVAFQGDGSVTLESGASGLPVLAFWRPVLLKEDSRYPVGGRMDCKIVATDGSFEASAFDPMAKHDAVAEQRAAQGFVDMKRLRDYGDHIRQLDVVGRRSRPRSHYVLSYIMVRDRDRLIDIRRNCSFIYGKGVSKPDVLPFVQRFTKLSFNFTPGDGGKPRALPGKSPAENKNENNS